MSISAGTLLGRYEIRSKIGAGGMGEVYLAKDTRLERICRFKKYCALRWPLTRIECGALSKRLKPRPLSIILIMLIINTTENTEYTEGAVRKISN